MTTRRERSTASTWPSQSATVYGFPGPNGAGKTTTIRMLATLLKPDTGTARVLGYDVVDDADVVRSRVASWMAARPRARSAGCSCRAR